MKHGNFIKQIVKEGHLTLQNKPVPYEEVKSLLCVDIVGTSQNAEILQSVPHTDIEDMSLVYRIRLGSTEKGETTVLMTNTLLESYGISVQQLHADAMESSIINRPAIIKTGDSLISATVGVPEGQIQFVPEAPQLFIVTNAGWLQGAAALFYPGIMEKAEDMLGGSYYILPSSVHEFLLLADDGIATGEHLKKIVKIVNRHEVVDKDKLTDNVYHWDAATHVFEQASIYEMRKAQN